MRIVHAIVAAAVLALAGSLEWVWAVEPNADLYRSLKCAKCHSITALGIALAEEEDDSDDFGEDEDDEEAPDLSGVGGKHDAAWLTKWMQKKVRNEDGKRHKKKFKGTDEELDAIVRFLSGLQ